MTLLRTRPIGSATATSRCAGATSADLRFHADRATPGRPRNTPRNTLTCGNPVGATNHGLRAESAALGPALEGEGLAGVPAHAVDVLGLQEAAGPLPRLLEEAQGPGPAQAARQRLAGVPPLPPAGTQPADAQMRAEVGLQAAEGRAGAIGEDRRAAAEAPGGVGQEAGTGRGAETPGGRAAEAAGGCGQGEAQSPSPLRLARPAAARPHRVQRPGLREVPVQGLPRGDRQGRARRPRRGVREGLRRGLVGGVLRGTVQRRELRGMPCCI